MCILQCLHLLRNEKEQVRCEKKKRIDITGLNT